MAFRRVSGEFNYVINQLGLHTMVQGNSLYSNGCVLGSVLGIYTPEMGSFMVPAFKRPRAGRMQNICCYLYV